MPALAAGDPMLAHLLALALAAQPAPAALPPAGGLDPGLDPGPALAPPPGESVYRLVPWLDVPLTALAAGVAILPARFPFEFITPRCPCDRREVNGFDRIAIDLHSRTADVISDLTVWASVGVPVVADALWLGNTRALREDLMILTETLALNAAAVMTVKFIVQRPLPVTYAQRDGVEKQAQGYRSFYSGHTSTAVAALTAASWTYTLRRGPATWPWLVTAAVGASVGVERVLAGRHFPTDVLVGAAAGFGFGSLVPLLHARGRRLPVAIAPLGVGRGLQLSATW